MLIKKLNITKKNNHLKNAALWQISGQWWKRYGNAYMKVHLLPHECTAIASISAIDHASIDGV